MVVYTTPTLSYFYRLVINAGIMHSVRWHWAKCLVQNSFFCFLRRHKYSKPTVDKSLSPREFCRPKLQHVVNLVRAPGCKSRASSVSRLEIVKGVPNQGVVCFVSNGMFFCLSFVFPVYVVFGFLVFGCQYQYNRLSGKTHLWNDLLCVEWDDKPYSLTHP